MFHALPALRVPLLAARLLLARAISVLRARCCRLSVVPSIQVVSLRMVVGRIVSLTCRDRCASEKEEQISDRPPLLPGTASPPRLPTFQTLRARPRATRGTPLPAAARLPFTSVYPSRFRPLLRFSDIPSRSFSAPGPSSCASSHFWWGTGSSGSCCSNDGHGSSPSQPPPGKSCPSSGWYWSSKTSSVPILRGHTMKLANTFRPADAASRRRHRTVRPRPLPVRPLGMSGTPTPSVSIIVQIFLVRQL